MALRITQLAEVLQTLLTDQADEAAQEAGFVKRRRKLTGSTFVQTLVLGWLDSPDASLEDLVAPPGTDKAICSPQALDQRLNEKATACLKGVLQKALEHVFAARPETIPLLRRFNGVYAEDGTTISLPATLAKYFRGCGGSGPGDGEAAIKLHVRWELTAGALTSVTWHEGRHPDVKAAEAAPELPSGALRLADRGFFDLEEFRALGVRGVQWISRLPCKTKLIDATDQAQSLDVFLAKQTGNLIDQPIRVGVKERLPARLLAFRSSPAVAAKRRDRLAKQAKDKGRKVSALQWALCEWTVFITNVSLEKLRPEEVWVLYRARWQIELLFKTWKSHGGLDRTKGRKPQRVLCELFAKLIGMVIRHWLVLLRGGPLAGFSWVKAVRWVRKRVQAFVRALQDGLPLNAVLERILACLNRIRKQPRRRTRPSTRQLLFQPRLMT